MSLAGQVARRLLPEPAFNLLKERWNRGKVVRPLNRPDLSFIVERHMTDLVRSRKYEDAEIQLVEERCKAGDIVLEIGGGFGVVACYIGKVIGTSGKLFTIEPDSYRRKYLSRNMTLNDLDFTIFPWYVGYNDTQPLNRQERNLAAILDEIQVTPTLIVMDAEGIERDLFLREAEVFAEIGADIIAELHPPFVGLTWEEIVRPLLERGFAVEERFFKPDVDFSVVLCTQSKRA